MSGERLPERVLFFRDGVSEGEFSRVREEEVGAIHGGCFVTFCVLSAIFLPDAFKEVGEIVGALGADFIWPPTLTFVVVGKRYGPAGSARFRSPLMGPQASPQIFCPGAQFVSLVVVSHPKRLTH